MTCHCMQKFIKKKVSQDSFTVLDSGTVCDCARGCLNSITYDLLYHQTIA